MMSTATALTRAWLESREPKHKGQDTKAQHGGDENARHPIDQPLHRGPAPLGLADQLDDVRQQGVGPDLLRAHNQAAVPIDGAADDTLPTTLLHRNGFAGNHRLIDGTLSLEDDAIPRHLFSRTNAQPVARTKAFQGYVFLLAVGMD